MALNWLLVFSSLFFSFGVSAAENANAKIQWYRPLIVNTLQNNHARVLIAGKTSPGNQVVIGAEAYSYRSQTDSSKLSPRDLAVSPAKAIADKDGVFQIALNLPYTAVQIPVIISDDKNQTSTIILLMHVEKNHVHVNVKTVARNRWRVYVGPAFKFFDVNESNSIATTSASSSLLGSTVGGRYQFRSNTYALASINSVEGVGSASGNQFTYNDFEVSLGVGRKIKTRWLKNWDKAIEVDYTNASSLFIVRDASSNFVFETAALNKLAAEFTVSYDNTARVTSTIGAGLEYGLLNSAKFDSSPGMTGGFLNYQISYRLDSQFFALGNLSAEYENYSFSNYDTPTATTISTSMSQIIGTATASIGFEF